MADNRRSGGTTGNGTRRHLCQRALQPRLLCRPPVFAAHLDDRPGRSAGGDDAVSRQRRPFQGKEDPPLVDANILGICISNLEGAIIEANEAFLRMLQYSREDVVSRRLRWTDLTPAEWREQNERSVAE